MRRTIRFEVEGEAWCGELVRPTMGRIVRLQSAANAGDAQAMVEVATAIAPDGLRTRPDGPLIPVADLPLPVFEALLEVGMDTDRFRGRDGGAGVASA